MIQLITTKCLKHYLQVAQLSQRERAAGCVCFGQQWKTGTGRQYFRDIIGPFSTTAKSSCFAIGKGNKLRISDMNLGPNSIQWCDSFKYLGVTFQAGPKLKINIDVIKHNFLHGIKWCVG